jgi:hypothetical protein
MSGTLAVDLGYNPFRSGASIEKARKTAAVESPPLVFLLGERPPEDRPHGAVSFAAQLLPC